MFVPPEFTSHYIDTVLFAQSVFPFQINVMSMDASHVKYINLIFVNYPSTVCLDLLVDELRAFDKMLHTLSVDPPYVASVTRYLSAVMALRPSSSGSS